MAPTDETSKSNTASKAAGSGDADLAQVSTVLYCTVISFSSIACHGLDVTSDSRDSHWGVCHLGHGNARICPPAKHGIATKHHVADPERIVLA